jgi:hypothetical protein
MKKREKAKKASIQLLVCELVNKKKMLGMEGKDAAQVLVPRVKKRFPHSKFKLDHVYWYLGQLRWQRENGLTTARLVSRAHKRGSK